jgi:hypothetical protein
MREGNEAPSFPSLIPSSLMVTDTEPNHPHACEGGWGSLPRETKSENE